MSIPNPLQNLYPPFQHSDLQRSFVHSLRRKMLIKQQQPKYKSEFFNPRDCRQPPSANPHQTARNQRTDLLRPSNYCGQTTITSFPGRQPGADEHKVHHLLQEQMWACRRWSWSLGWSKTMRKSTRHLPGLRRLAHHCHGCFCTSCCSRKRLTRHRCSCRIPIHLWSNGSMLRASA